MTYYLYTLSSLTSAVNYYQVNVQSVDVIEKLVSSTELSKTDCNVSISFRKHLQLLTAAACDVNIT